MSQGEIYRLNEQRRISLMSDSVEAPLIGNQQDAVGDDDLPHRDSLEGEANEELPVTHKHVNGAPGFFIWLLTLAAGISGLLFGCKKTH
jgi:hypothetical protein